MGNLIMGNFPFIQTLRQKWQVLFLVTLLILVTSFVISVVQIPKYKSSVTILITQKYGFNTDIYAASKFTEYLSNLLDQVIYSKSFFDEVMAAGDVKNDFSPKPEKRAKEWAKIVNTRVISNTGIISISVYHKERDQAEKLTKAIANVLVTKSDLYHGAGQQVLVRVIDGPITSERTAKPNIPLNLMFGLILGLVLGGVFIYLFPSLYLSEEWFAFGGPKVVEITPAQKDFGQGVSGRATS